MKWIESAGGPLICLETHFMSSWCGVDGAFQTGRCVPAQHSDYDRACAISNYTGLVDVGGDSVLVLGDLPMATTTFEKTKSEIYIVRAIYMDVGADISQLACNLDDRLFESPLERLSLKVVSDRLAIFDSALPGRNQNKEVLEIPLSPGDYDIRTVLVDPDPQTSLVLHRLIRIPNIGV
jgi:hypothetical protein